MTRRGRDDVMMAL